MACGVISDSFLGSYFPRKKLSFLSSEFGKLKPRNTAANEATGATIEESRGGGESVGSVENRRFKSIVLVEDE